MTATQMQGGPMAATTLQGEREIRVERIFNAPRDRVWRALTDASLVAQWWGRGNRLDVERLEVVRGGHWRFVEHSDGQTHGFEGRVREGEMISQTFEWDGMPGYPIIQTMTLEDLGDGHTKLVSISMFFTGQERDGMMAAGMEGGMNQSYQALDRVLAGMR